MSRSSGWDWADGSTGPHQPTAEQTQAFLRHAGAARFAYNLDLAATKAALAANDARTDGTRMKVPWSGLDHINHGPKPLQLALCRLARCNPA